MHLPEPAGAHDLRLPAGPLRRSGIVAIGFVGHGLHRRIRLAGLYADRRPAGLCQPVLQPGGQRARLYTHQLERQFKAGRKAAEIWPAKLARAAQKDTVARWTVKTSKGKVEVDGTIKRDLAIPAFGYKSHISIDRRHEFIRRQKVTDAATHDGARLRDVLIDPSNTASAVPPRPAGRGPFLNWTEGLLALDGPTLPTAPRPTRTS